MNSDGRYEDDGLYDDWHSDGVYDETLPLVEALDSSLDAVEAFRRLAHLPHVIFLDSAVRHPRLGRYSFVAADPIVWLDRGDVLWWFERLKDSFEFDFPPATRRDDLPPFQGGWAGLFGYELASSLEFVPVAKIDEFKLPTIALGLYDVVAAFDHEAQTAWLISQGLSNHNDKEARRKEAAQRMQQFREMLRGSGMIATPAPLRDRAIPLSNLAPQFPTEGPAKLTSNFSPQAYRETIQRAIEYIHAGDVFQVNLSQRLLHPMKANSVELYQRLRECNPAPFAGYLDGGGWQIISASPERFLRVDGNRVETRPIKGTRGRTRRPEADLFAADDLRRSEKDRAENVMIVDLMRNDLSHVCRPETVTVSQLCGLETYETVQHLVSVVEGTLRDEYTAIDLLSASFPGGSITGAPKIRAMQIIAELEPTVRGAYCGSLGYIGIDGRMDTNILIRTITASAGWWQIPVGGGIVAQSIPQEEFEETWHKAEGLLRALRKPRTASRKMNPPNTPHGGNRRQQ